MAHVSSYLAREKHQYVKRFKGMSHAAAILEP